MTDLIGKFQLRVKFYAGILFIASGPVLTLIVEPEEVPMVQPLPQPLPEPLVQLLPSFIPTLEEDWLQVRMVGKGVPYRVQHVHQECFWAAFDINTSPFR